MVTMDTLNDVLMQLNNLHDFPEPSELSELPNDMHPWDIIISVRHKLPPHERKVVEIMVKLGELAELIDEVGGVK
jgi:hypothetical protein